MRPQRDRPPPPGRRTTRSFLVLKIPRRWRDPPGGRPAGDRSGGGRYRESCGSRSNGHAPGHAAADLGRPAGIGYEAREAPYWTTGSCPAMKRCLIAAAALVRLTQVVSYSFGKIAHPTFRGIGTDTGSITFTHLSPNFEITAKAPGHPLAGTFLNKVGRRTGWTGGWVSGTCVSTGVYQSDFYMVCQDKVAARVDPGDSGSAVFETL